MFAEVLNHPRIGTLVLLLGNSSASVVVYKQKNRVLHQFYELLTKYQTGKLSVGEVGMETLEVFVCSEIYTGGRQDSHGLEFFN